MARNGNGGRSAKASDPLGFRALSHVDWKKIPLWKIVLVGIASALALMVALSLVGSALKGIAFKHGMMRDNGGYATTPSFGSRDSALGYGEAVHPGMAVSEYAKARVIAPIPPSSGYTTGDSAEEYEARSYTAEYETGSLASVCNSIEQLKPSRQVIFEHAYTTDSYCSYRFKVANNSVDSILEYLRKLSPKELTQSTESVKQQVDEFMNRREILVRSADSLEEVLRDAIASYDSLTALATREGNADALARSVARKIELIDQLRQRREMLRHELDALNRAEAELADRMAYTIFYVEVQELKYVNLTRLRDSWNEALQKFVSDINTLIQTLTLGLFTFLFYLVMFALYGFILLLVAKYGWRFVRDIWRA